MHTSEGAAAVSPRSRQLCGPQPQAMAHSGDLQLAGFCSAPDATRGRLDMWVTTWIPDDLGALTCWIGLLTAAVQ
jgi:hypothetical protein